MCVVKLYYVYFSIYEIICELYVGKHVSERVAASAVEAVWWHGPLSNPWGKPLSISSS